MHCAYFKICIKENLKLNPQNTSSQSITLTPDCFHCRFSLFLPSLEQILKPVFFRSEIPGITLKYESGL